MQELHDLNAAQCEREYKAALQECSAELARITTRLKDQIDTPASWPRVGSLLAVRAALYEARRKIPMSEAEMIKEASTRG